MQKSGSPLMNCAPGFSANRHLRRRAGLSCFRKNLNSATDYVLRIGFGNFNLDKIAGAQLCADVFNIVDEYVPIDFLRLSRHAALDQKIGLFAYALNENRNALSDEFLMLSHPLFLKNRGE